MKKNSTFVRTLKSLFLGAKHAEPTSILEEEAMMSPIKTIMKNFISNKLALAGVITFTTIFLACFIIPIFRPLDTSYSDLTQSNIGPGFNMMSVPSELSSDLKVLSAGATYGAGVTNSGEIYIYGKVTDSKIIDNIPSNMGNIIDISAGYNHIVALNDKGEVFCWGYDRLGVTTLPPEINYTEGEIIEIDAGYQISYALTDAGELIYWGNENLMDLRGLAEVEGEIVEVEFNSSTGIVLTSDGYVYCLAKTPTPIASIPESIQGNVRSLALTEKTALAVTNDNEVVIWGETGHATLIVPEEALNYEFAVVEGGRNHFTALTTDGEVFSWGADNYNQSSVPSKVTNIETIVTDYHQNYAIDQDGKLYSWGLKGHLMGTDGYGRDIFTRLVSGGRMTITVGSISVVIATIIGVTIGGIAGYYGGTIVDDLLMRFAEIVSSLPFLPFAMILSSVLGNSISETQRIMLIMVILGVLGWTGLARLTRAQILSEREKEFVTAAKAIGIKEFGIIFKHILPNVITVLIVSVTLSFASSMLTESSLSFLGFGVVEPNPTWGNMLNSAKDSKIISTYWWQWVFPALALSLCTISINSIGDGLREAIDPHSNDR